MNKEINQNKDFTLYKLLEQLKLIKEEIKLERQVINKKLEKLLRERHRLANAISRAKNYRKTKSQG